MQQTFLDILAMELQIEPKELIEPNVDVGERDHVAGKVEREELKRLFHLSKSCEKSAMESAVAARYTNNEELKKKEELKSKMLHQKSELILDIFWASLRENFGLWDKHSVGIRRGWKVVWIEQLGIPPMLIDILGGGF